MSILLKDQLMLMLQKINRKKKNNQICKKIIRHITIKKKNHAKHQT